ncbi:MAG: CrcB family protein [Planctomycetota bacterium]
MPASLSAFALVALGGAVGAALRYGVGVAVARIGGGFPLATLIVNVLGCFGIGFTLAWLGRGGSAGDLAQAAPPGQVAEAARALAQEAAATLRLVVVVGFLGGFTTFSAFGQESVALLRSGAWGGLAVSLALNLGLGFAAVVLGAKLGA